MLTAHYDHLGMRATGADKIFNGANDDGSGTVSVMEIASAIAAQNPHPKRSILFVTFFGEELGPGRLALLRAPSTGAAREHRSPI